MSRRPFTRIAAVAAPLIRPNVDTDAIIPSREVTGVTKGGLSKGLFAGWRYRSGGGREPDPDFILNHPAYAGAEILLGGPNFGCGSSREHAVWALAEYGFRVVIAPSFSPIFQNNCVRNGLLPVVAPALWIAALAGEIAPDPQTLRVSVDLPSQTVTSSNGSRIEFQIGEDAKDILLEGLDIIDLTMKRMGDIEQFRAKSRSDHPWAFI